jgi:ribosomal protein S18 acetylase RimI-like enzyme
MLFASMTSTIRPLTSRDDDRVVAAIVSSTLFEPGDGEMLASLLAEHHVGRGAEGQRWLVDVEDGEIIGTVMYRPVEAADRTWDLTLIAVRAERQGGGVGRRLMAHVEHELREEDQRTLVVQPSGLDRFTATRGFYRRLGYTERGRVPDYWADGDDMVLLSKVLRERGAEPARASQLRVVTVDGSELDALKPLWLQLHHHHRASLPSFTGFVVDDESSWRARLALYRRVLGNRQGFVLVAELDGRVVGYAAVELLDGADDTFAVGPRHAEVLTLVVDEDVRGAGLGTRLLDEVDAKLAAAGIKDLVISVMLGNDRARHFYERRGLVPAETYLWRVALT